MSMRQSIIRTAMTAFLALMTVAGLATGSDDQQGQPTSAPNPSESIGVEKPEPKAKLESGDKLLVKGQIKVPEGGSPPQVVEVSLISLDPKVQQGSWGLRYGKRDGDDFYILEDDKYVFQKEGDQPLKPGRYSVTVKSFRVVRGKHGKTETITEVADKILFEVEK